MYVPILQVSLLCNLVLFPFKSYSDIYYLIAIRLIIFNNSNIILLLFIALHVCTNVTFFFFNKWIIKNYHVLDIFSLNHNNIIIISVPTKQQIILKKLIYL